MAVADRSVRRLVSSKTFHPDESVTTTHDLAVPSRWRSEPSMESRSRTPLTECSPAMSTTSAIRAQRILGLAAARSRMSRLARSASRSQRGRDRDRPPRRPRRRRHAPPLPTHPPLPVPRRRAGRSLAQAVQGRSVSGLPSVRTNNAAARPGRPESAVCAVNQSSTASSLWRSVAWSDPCRLHCWCV